MGHILYILAPNTLNAILSIAQVLTTEIDFASIINDSATIRDGFASIKAGKTHLQFCIL